MRKPRRRSPQNRWTRDPVKEEYWRKQISLWQQSGLSVRAFCKEHGVVETSFYAWRRELIIRARETGETDPAGELTPNKLKDARGRNVSIRFRQTDHRALEKELEEEPTTEAIPFVPLSIVSETRSKHAIEPGINSSVTITTPAGYRISVSNANDLALLEKILNTLEKHIC